MFKLPFMNRVRKKENPVGAVAFISGNYAPGPRNTKGFAEEGYKQNSVVFACIHELARAGSCIPLKIVENTGTDQKEVDNHDMLKLIKRPNPSWTWKRYCYRWITEYLYAGNAYHACSTGAKNQPLELWLINPINMKIVEGKSFPLRYEYQGLRGKTVFDVDPISGESKVLHTKTFNPLNEWYGMSALQAAAFNIDINNSGAKYNKALLDNGARPSGVLKTKQSLSEAAAERLKEMVRTLFQGYGNAGEVAVLEEELEWQETSWNPRDMEYATTMDVSARSIASVLGVPFHLIVPEGATYNNLRDAREAMWTNTVIPLMQQLLEDLSNWLNVLYGEDQGKYSIVMDLDDIPALEPKRQRKFDRTIKAVDSGLITRNEARDALGFDEIKNTAADMLFVPSTQIPLDMAGLGEDVPDPGDGKAMAIRTLKAAGYNDEQVEEELKKLGY